jgi:hypothetical protein
MSSYYYGQKTTSTIKKKPKIVPKRFDLTTLRHKFSSDGYYRTCHSLVGRINDQFSIPQNIIDIPLYEKHYDEIVQHLLEHYTIRDHVGLTAKMATLAYPMKMVGYDGSFIHRKKQLLQLPIKMKPADKVITPWDELKDSTLHDAYDRCLHPGGKIVCLSYLHGYPLRLHEIVNTSIKATASYNFLDVNEKIWHIRRQHSKTRTDRKFDVTQEFIDDILPLVHASGHLVSRKNGQPYGVSVTLKSLCVYGVSVNEVRNSYETWNYARDVDDDTKHKISISVLGHNPATAMAHYTRNDLANTMTSADGSLPDSDDKDHD